MVTGCWVLRRRDFGSVGVDDASDVTFGFFARLGGVGLFVSTVLMGLESRSGRALRLRDLGSGWAAAEVFAGVAAADEDSAASFVAERVTLEDMRNWVFSRRL